MRNLLTTAAILCGMSVNSSVLSTTGVAERRGDFYRPFDEPDIVKIVGRVKDAKASAVAAAKRSAARGAGAASGQSSPGGR